MKKCEGLFSHTVMLGAATAFSKAVAFLLLPFYTAHLTPAEFGTADVLVDTAVLLLPFISLNAPEAVFRFLVGRGEEDKRIVISSGIALFAIGLCSLGVLLPFARLSLLLFSYLPYLIGYMLASLSRSLLAHILRAEGRYGLYALQQLCCALLTVLLQVLFLAPFHLGVRGYLLGVILSDAAIAVALLLCTKPWHYFSIFAVRREKLRAMLAFALPLIPTAALWWVISLSDRYVLLHYRGSAAIGLYAAASRITAALGFAIGIFLETWQYAALRVSKARRGALYARIYDMLLPVAIFGAACLLLASPFLVSWLYAPEYGEAAVFIPFLTLAALFSALSSFFSSIYTVALRSGATLLTSLIGAAINLLLNFLLIPTKGAVGAALATLAAYAAIFAVRLFHSRKYLNFPRHAVRSLFSFSCLMLSASFMMQQAYRVALMMSLAAVLLFLREMLTVFSFFLKRLTLFLHIRQKNTEKY